MKAAITATGKLFYQRQILADAAGKTDLESRLGL
jgi:hypothetical protein